MIHHRQRLPLRLEAGDDLLGVHAQLDNLQRHAPSHRFSLLRDIHHAAPAFADPLQKFVTPERLAHGFVFRRAELREALIFREALDFGRALTGSWGLAELVPPN